MYRFDEVVNFLAGYSSTNQNMESTVFNQLKEVMSSYLDMEDIVNQSEMILSRIFKIYGLAFMKVGIIVKKHNNIIEDLEMLTRFVESVDKSQSENNSKSKAYELRNAQYENLEKEYNIARANQEILTQKCGSMDSEIISMIDELKLNKTKIEELEEELDRTKSLSFDSVEHFQTLYDSAIKEKNNFAKRNSVELTGLTTANVGLERELENLKSQLDSILSTNLSNEQKIKLSENQLSVIKGEYTKLKDKYMKQCEEHNAEIVSYQSEIEELKYKLIESKKTMRRQDSVTLSIGDNGLEDRIMMDNNLLADAFKTDDIERFSKSSTGSRACNVDIDNKFVKKENSFAKRHSVVSINQNTTESIRLPGFSNQNVTEVDKEVMASLKAALEASKKNNFGKDLEIEELKMKVTSAHCQLSDIMNEFTDEILIRDKQILSLRRELKAVQSSGE